MTKKIFTICSCFFMTLLLLGSTNQSFGEILFQDNFNYSDSPNNHGWSAGPTSSIAPGAGPDGSNALKIAFNCDSNSCGDRFHNWTVPATTSELSIKFNFKMDCGAGNCVGGAKFLKLFGIRNGDNYANTTFQLIYQTSTLEQILYGCSGDTRDAINVFRYNSPPGIYNSCSNSSSPEITTSRGSIINPKDGQWHTLAVQMKYNDDGINNGLYNVWYDDVKVIGVTDVNNRSNTNSKYFKTVQIGGWNQYYGGIPYDIYYDNFIVTTIPKSPTLTRTPSP